MKHVKCKPRKSRVYPSIKAAASALGVSDSTLRDAKGMGCPAFNANNTVDGAVLVPWLAEHEKELAGGGFSLRDKKVAEEIRKLRIRNDKDEGKVVLRSEVINDAQEHARWEVQFLTQKLVNEYPSIVAGLDVPGAMAYGRRLVVTICEAEQQFIKRWSK